MNGVKQLRVSARQSVDSRTSTGARAGAATGVDRAKWAPVIETRHSLRHLQRVALGTPYPEVVARVREVVRSEKLAGRSDAGGG